MYFNYRRRLSSEVKIGNLKLGGCNEIRLQSMTTTSTLDTEGSVTQCECIINAGADLVRLTTQGSREAENLKNIREALRQKGVNTPLVADVHFNPKVADVAATIVEKVRINPGNYIDNARVFKKIEYTDEQYANEVLKIRERLVPFLNICKENNTAIRIGVNHGSLSDRIMSRYGDTPSGIVESCMEFLRICKEEEFNNVVISIKASNTAVMVQSVRLLVDAMEKEDMYYPLHLGVTEAGEGEDGRIKSAVGIGALLMDGIGDTIRVSLSEEPEVEIPVARKLRDYVVMNKNLPLISGQICEEFDYLNPQRRKTFAVGDIGGDNTPIIISDYCEEKGDNKPDYFYLGDEIPKDIQSNCRYIVDADKWIKAENIYPAFNYTNIGEIKNFDSKIKFLFLPVEKLCDKDIIACLKKNSDLVIIIQSCHPNYLGSIRSGIHCLMNNGIMNPCVLYKAYNHAIDELEDFQIESSVDMGALLFDGLCDGLYLVNEAEGGLSTEIVCHTAFSILQAAGLRRTHTEFISCPGCGRTLYDLQQTIARIKDAISAKDASKAKNLKIAVMGCIVNGPGEMADADYGYVGAARGKISLYKNKQCLEMNIPENEAVEKLLSLLEKDNKL